MLLAAAALSLAAGKVPDFFIIIFLFCSNFAISIWHEGKADKSIEKLKEHLAVTVRVFRDGRWVSLNAISLVPGDVVECSVGALIPADLSVIEAKNLSINESVLTGESLPKQKAAGDVAYSGSFVTTGHLIGEVTATGGRTYFGKTISLIDVKPRRSALETDILSISKLISVLSIAVIVVLTIVLTKIHAPLIEVVTLDLSLLIAGIPVALPTVMSLIISIGVLELSKRNIIVRRLASLEDLANVDLLLSDKTGTLTQNKIHVERTIPLGGITGHEAIILAASALAPREDNPLNKAILDLSKKLDLTPYHQQDYIPGDSERKRSTAIILVAGMVRAVSFGAPQVIETLCDLTEEERGRFQKIIADAAGQGYRTLALAYNDQGTEEREMKLIGVFFLADRLHEDAAETVQFMRDNGIGVKMLTGDNIKISERIAQELGLKGAMEKRELLDGKTGWTAAEFDGIAGFAEVLPKDKYDAVILGRKFHTVAVTGDGVNDLPAVKAADVGFAVKNAVDALKSSADIVLLADGISVIKNAIIEARKIFMRLYNYSVYRISESFRVIITIAVIGFLYKTYPLTPIQLIVLALLNDLPIVSLAFDRVKTLAQPAHINAKERFALSILFGLVGVANSLILLFVMVDVLHLPWEQIQTVFFLKLTVSGHMLIYIAHTKERWYKFLPSVQVIAATTVTQIIATLFALFGIFTTPVSFTLVALVWIWSFFWMQVGELMKSLQQRILKQSA